MIPTATEILLKCKVLFVSINTRLITECLGKVEGDLLQLLPHLDFVIY